MISMACKFHNLQEYIIDKVNALVKRDCELPIINYYDIHELRLGNVFVDAYSKFYNNADFRYIFEMAGAACEENIKNC